MREPTEIDVKKDVEIMEKIYKYNAFISYRHTSPDKNIADKLQKKLENYKPPRSLSDGKRSGGLRIFRDETELPTSSDLSNDIKTALEESKYLIVICSKTTGDSRWCMEEIEYFKQLHNGSNSNIITVVADGNPEDVFPPSLCNELIPVTDENGITTYQNHIIEPLAANVSGKSLKESFKKLDTEFLRVAAPLLGCGYDDLYNREHKKKIRRILTVGSIALSLLLLFAVYNSAMLWQINNQKIALAAANEDLQKKTEELEKTNQDLEKKTEEAEDNLTEANKQKKIAEDNMLIAQENEAKANEANRNLRIKNSEILANQAQLYLDNDDIYSAISTALEALPQDGEDIPSSAVAEYVVTTAANAYDSSDKMVRNSIILSSYVKFLEFSEDGTRLLAEDTAGNIYIIDYENNKVIKTYTAIETFGETSGYITDICVDGNTGLVACNDQLVSINLHDGSINWHYNKDKKEPHSIYSIITNPKSDYIVIPGYKTYIFLDKTGKIVFKAVYNHEDPNYVYISYKDYVYMDSAGTVYIVQPEGSYLHRIDTNSSQIYPIDIMKNDEVLFVGENEDCIFLNVGVSVEGTTAGHNNAKMICINKKDMAVKWNTSYKVDGLLYGSDYNTMFDFTHNLPNASGTNEKHNGILVASGTHILCFDRQTGELYYSTECDYDNRILYCAPNTAEYSIKIATPKRFSANVYLKRSVESDDPIYGEPGDYLFITNGYTFDKKRSFIAYSGEDRFALASEDSSEISMYHKTSFDNHNAFKNYPTVDGVIGFIVDDGQGTFAAYYYHYNNKTKERHIVIYDTRNDICRAFFKETIDVSTMVFKNNKLLIFDTEGNSKVLDYSGQTLEEFSLKEKIITAAGLKQTSYISFYSAYIYLTEDNIVLCVNKGIFTINLSQENAVVEEVISVSSLISRLDDYCITDSFVSFIIELNKDKITKIAYFIDGDKQLSYVSDNGSEAAFLSDSISSVVNTAVGNRIAFISKEGYIGICNYGGDSITRIALPQGEIHPVSIKFTPDGKALIAICSNGRFIKYNAENGQIEGEYIADFAVGEHTTIEFMDERSFYIRSFRLSDDIVIIDTESMQKLAKITNFVMYMKSERKIIYCRNISDNKDETGYFNYLTTAQVIDLAKDFLERK